MALRMLVVAAHPDDEALGFGGVLARAAGQGIETYLVTATRGDRGRYFGHPPGAPEHPGAAALAELRERELLASAAVLGIRDVTVLGYPDAGLDAASVPEIVGRLARHIRHLRPQVVLTFGPDGAYGHPDHIAIAQFTTTAIVAAGSPADGDSAAGQPPDLPPHAVSKLYYLAWNEQDWAAYQTAFKKLTFTVDGVVRQAVPWTDWAITTVVDTRQWWRQVWQAIGCHQSQVGAYQALASLADEQREQLWGSQSFYRVFSLVNGGRQRESDVFAGLTGT